MGTIIKIGNIASGEKDVNNKELRQELNENWKKALEIMFKALYKFIFEGWVNKI